MESLVMCTCFAPFAGFSFETEGPKQALAIAFCKAQSKPVALRKPLLLVIATRCIFCPDYIKQVLEKDEDEGLTV
ncbi:hypothetical protein AMTR_s00040p00033490 [Amborella trichopoda]|uniref:Uncharacterized protein n=1 Tax=Amborella trichopoda TaxID=13333 RepID=W1PYE2_AMBTC|nr:hypothetical protein AMTR_s00040p00033490 [Amborella trichopoda]